MPRTSTIGTAGRRHPRRLAVAVVVVILSLVSAAIATRYQPAWSRGRIPAGTDIERAAARMLTKASAIRAGVARPGDWGEAISEAEVNAWLAHDLPRVAPGALPTWAGSPSVRFLPRRVAVSSDLGAGLLAARAWAVFTVVLRRDNELVVGVDSAGLGFLPIPPGTVLGVLEARALRAGLPAERDVLEGRPALVVRLPGRLDTARAGSPEYHLQGVRVDDGEVVLAGSTRPAAGP